MKLGISGYELAPGLAEVVRLATLHDIQQVELWPQNMLPGGAQAVRDLLTQHGLSACVFTLPFATRLNHPNEQVHLEQIRDALRLAVELGAGALNIKVGPWPARTPLEALLWLVPVLRRLGAEAQAQRMRILVENQVDEDGEDVARANWSRSPENLRALLEVVAHPAVKATYDPGNFLMAGYEPFPLGYELLAPYLAYVHVKDAALDHGLSPAPPGSLFFADGIHQQRYRARPVGSGAVNWAGLIRQLDLDGYEGVLMLDGFTPEVGRDAFYHQSVQSLRTYLSAQAK